MRLLNVKSTILNQLMNTVAPYYCYSCGEIGSLLCDSCKYDIIDEHIDSCLLCGHPTSFDGGCKSCKAPFKRSWLLARREGALKDIIDAYKFAYVESAYQTLGDLLLACLPDLPAKTVVVPVPTVRAHIRERGYDHAKLLAEYIADKRELQCKVMLERATSTKQRGADRKKRLAQAKEAFKVNRIVNPDVPCLLVDDIVTTGATITYATEALRQAGVKTVWATALARQPLD